MNYNINIYIDDTGFTSVNYDDFSNSIDIDLNLTPNDDLKTTLDKKNLIKILRDSLESLKDDPDMVYSFEALDKIILSEENILENATISINFSNGIGEFIKNNSCLSNKEIYINEEFEINHNDLDLLLNELDGFTNVKIKVDGNDDYVSIEDYKKTVEAIDEIVSKVKKYNLSPLEQVMYSYDLVRDRVYTRENENESATKSRDLTSVLLGDKIVCVGYANIFEKVLSNLGIKNMMYGINSTKNNLPGHRRNVAYIKDEKYSVEGVYYFDPTWDSKKSEDDKEYLDSYRFFCCLKEDIEAYTKGQFADRTFGGYNESFCWEFEDLVSENGIQNVPRNMVKTINEISEFIDDKKLINTMIFSRIPQLTEMAIQSFDLESVMDELSRYRSLFFDETLSASKLMQLLFNVRKIEYIEDPDKYPLSMDNFKKALLTAESSRLRSPFFKFSSPKDRREITTDEFNNEAEEQELSLNIERIKLVKVLQRASLKK